MSKLSLEALKVKADVTNVDELLNTISGGIENACHDSQEGIRPKDIPYTNYIPYEVAGWIGWVDSVINKIRETVVPIFN